MKKLLTGLAFFASLFITAVPSLADDVISSGLTVTVPSVGSRNWGTTFKNSFATPISAHDHTGGGKGLQISTNALATNAVTDAKIRLTNNGYLKARNAANSGDINIVKVNASDAIEFASVPNIGVPPGVISPYGGSSAPANWLLCDGSAVSRTTYAALFAVVGTTFGVGDGSTTFNLPDLRQRFPLGKAASGTGSTLGGTGGNIDHTHSVPAHFHGMGTGSDFNITAGGAHTHSIDHDHAAVTSAGDGGQTTSSNGDHHHLLAYDSLVGPADNSVNSTTRPTIVSDYDGTGDFSYNLQGTANGPNAAYSDTTGAHTHTVPSHTHSVDLPNFTGTSGSSTHTHVTGTMAGRVGLVTGGVDGNAAMTSGTGNPPFQAVNYIIKQ